MMKKRVRVRVRVRVREPAQVRRRQLLRVEGEEQQGEHRGVEGHLCCLGAAGWELRRATEC
eukprot:2134019-Rhodomonas_salina.1